MITLAFDSTAKTASCALCDGERLIGVLNVDNGLTQSELLLPMAEDVLRAAKLSFSDVELLACSIGPGSFTGVRIGAALVKGLAFAKNTPCAAVSTLEALAENLSGLKGIFVPVMDARRAQVYTAIFRSDGCSYERVTEDSAISLTELAAALRSYSDAGEPIYLVGDGYKVAERALVDAGVRLETTPELLRAQNAYSIAKIALRQHELGLTVTERELKPTYLRLPQAERERLERSKENDKKKEGSQND
jgi:tRNA threonylcarbamoyladenosine biosynthesis protein TsaB